MNYDTKIIGDSMLGGGNFNNIQIIGNATANEAVICHNMQVMGLFKAEKDVTARKISVIGEASIGGNCKFDTASVAGLITTAGDWKGVETDLKGSISVGGSFETETATVNGSLNVDGRCNFDHLEIISHYPNRIRELGGRRLVVRPPYVTGFFQRKTILVTDCIEADDIEIDYVDAKVVRGREVKIGGHCNVGLVEYSGSLEVAEGAKVEASRKLGEL